MCDPLLDLIEDAHDEETPFAIAGETDLADIPIVDAVAACAAVSSRAHEWMDEIEA